MLWLLFCQSHTENGGVSLDCDWTSNKLARTCDMFFKVKALLPIHVLVDFVFTVLEKGTRKVVSRAYLRSCDGNTPTP